MLSIISKTNSIDTSYIIFRDNKLFLHFYCFILSFSTPI